MNGNRASVLVIGYGNPLRGDDGAGPLAAEQVGALRPDVEALAVHQLTPELADALAGRERVVFIDAAAALVPAGVEVRKLRPRPGAAPTHHSEPEALLALTRDLHGDAPEASLVTVAGEDFGLRHGLTEAARANVAKAVERVLELLEGASDA